jgi:5'-phosphate synthase pdxT subunit
MSDIVVGVLALQGAFHEHVVALNRIPGVRAIEIRTPEQLAEVKGLVLPGGESTTIGLLAQRGGLLEPMRAFIQAGRPVFGTCAGMVLLADEVIGQKHDGQALLGGLDAGAIRLLKQ